MRHLLLSLFLFLFLPFGLPAQEQWTLFTSGNEIKDMALRENTLWCATGGGIVRWDLRDMSYRKLTIRDGLPRNDIACIEVASDGAVWFGSKAGLTRYDSDRFETFTEHDGLAANEVNALDFAPDGTLWIGTTGGVTCYDGERWTSHTASESGKLQNIGIIMATPAGEIYAGVKYQERSFIGKDLYERSGPLFKMEGSEWKEIAEGVQSIATTPSGEVYFCSEYRLFRIHNGETILTDTDSAAFISSISAGPDGSIWGIRRYPNAHVSEGIARLDGSAWTVFLKDDSPRLGYSMSLEIDSHGAVWVGTNTGLFRFDGLSWSAYATMDGIPENRIISLAVEQSAAVWASSGKTIMRYDGATWNAYYGSEGSASSGSSPQYAPFHAFHEVSIASDGTAFAGDFNMFSFSRFNGTRWEKFFSLPENSHENRMILTFQALSWDTLLIGSAYHGWGTTNVSFLEHKDRTYFTERFICGIDTIAAKIAVMPDSTSAYATAHGLYFIDKAGVLSHFTVSDGLPDNIITSVALSPAGDIWCGTPKGLCRYDGTRWCTFAASDGANFTDFTAAAFGMDGSAWFGTPNGLHRFDGSAWRTYTMADGLADPEVLSVAVAKDVTVWAGTAAGLSRITFGLLNVQEIRNRPEEIHILSNHPNPFNPSTSISFTLPISGEVDLAVYSITGQKVCTLVSGQMTFGSHTVIWDGKTDNGSTVASGVYIARLRKGKTVAARRMLLVR